MRKHVEECRLEGAGWLQINEGRREGEGGWLKIVRAKFRGNFSVEGGGLSDPDCGPGAASNRGETNARKPINDIILRGRSARDNAIP